MFLPIHLPHFSHQSLAAFTPSPTLIPNSSADESIICDFLIQFANKDREQLQLGTNPHSSSLVTVSQTKMICLFLILLLSDNQSAVLASTFPQ